MRQAGTPQAGYEITVDRERGLLTLRAWGFWDVKLADQFSQAMHAAFAEFEGEPWDILTDGSNFVPQSAAVGQVIGGLMAVAPSMGNRRAANVVNRSLDEIQLRMLASQNKLPNIAFFRTVAEAERWLGAGTAAA